MMTQDINPNEKIILTYRELQQHILEGKIEVWKQILGDKLLENLEDNWFEIPIEFIKKEVNNLKGQLSDEN